MQHFVDGFIAQCKRHNLRAELILVEWNPPSDRPPLSEALHYPRDKGDAEIRIIQVPKEAHDLWKYSEKLPLFQMIAKNVGIYRARGEFVLATNIDILFSDGLMHFIKKRLKKGVVYRVDRLDIPTDLPKTEKFEEILSHCHNRFFRINGKRGTLIKINDKWINEEDLKKIKNRINLREIFLRIFKGLQRFKDSAREGTLFGFAKRLVRWGLGRIVSPRVRRFAKRLPRGGGDSPENDLCFIEVTQNL